jgi:hypothetical protein
MTRIDSPIPSALSTLVFGIMLYSDAREITSDRNGIYTVGHQPPPRVALHAVGNQWLINICRAPDVFQKLFIAAEKCFGRRR